MRLPQLLLLNLSALALFSACQPKTAAPPPPPPTVQVTRPIQRDEPIYAEWVGTLDGLVNAQVRAQVTGYLLHQNYTEGAQVKAGDLLFEVDPRPFQAIVDQASANADKAATDLKRTSELVEKQVVSHQDYDNAVSANAAAQASLAQARLNLEFTKIKSPIDGIAGLALVQIGDLVSGSSGILTTVSTLNPIKAYFSISEQSYLQFKRTPLVAGHQFPEDLELELILSDESVFPEKGKFYATDRQIDSSTGTITLAGTFPNQDNLLRPGQYARIRSAVSVVKNALEIPQRSVTELQSVYQVIVVDGSHVAHVRTVKVGQRVGSRWIIAEGLQPTDEVIVEGQQKVRDGMTVATQELGAPPSAATAN